jgi:hypothetical protein
MRPEVFRFVSLVVSFILASSTLGFAQAADGERNNFADFLERLDIAKGPITFGFGEQAIFHNIERQTILIRYTATKLQRQVAEQNARTYIAKLSPEKKQQLKKKVQYLAVPTVPSKKTPPGAKPVMIIYLPRETLASNDVYELSTTPKPGMIIYLPRETLASSNVYELSTTSKPGKFATYDDIVAQYVGH